VNLILPSVFFSTWSLNRLIVFATTSWGGFLIPTFSVIVPDWAKVLSPKVASKKMEQRITRKVVRFIKVILFIPTPPS
jgi:hypothetical protein